MVLPTVSAAHPAVRDHGRTEYIVLNTNVLASGILTGTTTPGLLIGAWRDGAWRDGA
jgi:hypothetical protein